VTGASRGIGASIAKQLAVQGHPVVLNFLSSDDAARKVQSEIEALGGEAQLAQFDVTDRAQAHSVIEALLADERPLCVLVNNAGVIRDNAFPSQSGEDWDAVISTTLDGFYNVTRPLVMPMVRQRWGRIVNISSVSAMIAVRGQTNYSAAKAGLIGATLSLAQELAKRGITVNAVAPGLVDTEMIAEVARKQVIDRIPARRLGRPEEVAALVRFLVSDDAAYITGQVIGINGGLA
jgi:3-oxoacyl-[acyl-carrier protein] reductase